jgi:hypothetical protein
MILIDIIQVMRQLETPVRESPPFCSNNPPQARKPSCGLAQPFPVPIRGGFAPQLSECIVHIKA